MKNKNGITLIALVITIVVLIILAGVVINLSLGENGLFQKAKYGAESYTNATKQEETKIAEYTNELNGYVTGNRDYETEINNLKSEIQNLKNLNSFSTTEKIVGKWIDGEDLYQKTVNVGQLPSATEKLIAHNITNLDKFINIYGTMYSNQFHECASINYANVGNDLVIHAYYNHATYGSNIRIITSTTAFSSYSAYVTLQYTKTSNSNN